MTSSESLRPLEELKDRLTGIENYPSLSDFKRLAKDAIRLCEIYREFGWKYCDLNDQDVDQEASRLFKGEDGVK